MAKHRQNNETRHYMLPNNKTLVDIYQPYMEFYQQFGCHMRRSTSYNIRLCRNLRPPCLRIYRVTLRACTMLQYVKLLTFPFWPLFTNADNTHEPILTGWRQIINKSGWVWVIMLWCGIWQNQIIWPSYFVVPVTGESYLNMFGNKMMPHMHSLGRENPVCFQHDEAPLP